MFRCTYTHVRTTQPVQNSHTHLPPSSVVWSTLTPLPTASDPVRLYTATTMKVYRVKKLKLSHMYEWSLGPMAAVTEEERVRVSLAKLSAMIDRRNSVGETSSNLLSQVRLTAGTTPTVDAPTFKFITAGAKTETEKALLSTQRLYLYSFKYGVIKSLNLI